MRLARLFAQQDGLLIASPEYNSLDPAALLKNTIDWISRVRRDGDRALRPYEGKVVALCSSSDGNFAGVRGLYHLRAVLMNCRRRDDHAAMFGARAPAKRSARTAIFSTKRLRKRMTPGLHDADRTRSHAFAKENAVT